MSQPSRNPILTTCRDAAQNYLDHLELDLEEFGFCPKKAAIMMARTVFNRSSSGSLADVSSFLKEMGEHLCSITQGLNALSLKEKEISQ